MLIPQQSRDTVCSVGLIPHTLPFTSANGAIKTFRHALSLDEHRAKFKANHYQWPTEEEMKRGVQPGEMPKAGQRGPATKSKSGLGSIKRTNSQVEEEHEREFSAADGHNSKTDVLEVWFAGCHCGAFSMHAPRTTAHRLTVAR